MKSERLFGGGNDSTAKLINNIHFIVKSQENSILIVGMCEENVLYDIYAFLTKMLKAEFEHICQSLITSSMLKDKKKKVRRKVVMIMTTSDPLPNTNTDLEGVNHEHSDSQSQSISKKEDDIVSVKTEKKVKRSYNKKKTSLPSL